MAVPPKDNDATRARSAFGPDDERDPLDEFAEDFLRRLQRGERPSIGDYVAQMPSRKDELMDLLSALAFVEEVKSDADATMEAAQTLRPQELMLERLGDYRILREVGRGGMGIVYEAEQESLGRHVAVKVLARRSLIGAEQVQRFLREARAAAQLHHTNIVPVFFVGEHDGYHYYVMQFIRGLGLDAVLEEVRRLEHQPVADQGDIYDAETRIGRFDVSPSELAQSLVRGPVVEAPPGSRSDRPTRVSSSPHEASCRAALSSATGSGSSYARTVARIGLQVADALDYAHKQGVLHRDIKPSNLLLDMQGNTWITDFGLAKATEDDDLTRTGDLVGTLRYMAPERFRGRCDIRSDIYATGLTLYELLALRPAFNASERDRLIYEVTQTDPPRLRSVARGVPRDLETIIEKAISREPKNRYPSAAEFARDLERFLDDRPIQARRTSTAERAMRWARRNPGLTSLGATIVALLVVIAIGSVVATVYLSREHQQALVAVQESQEKLWESYLAQARASRRSDSPGRRVNALQYLKEAAELEVHQERRPELRDEAIAVLALSDVVPGKRFRPVGLDPSSPVCFDREMKRYAYLDSEGQILIRSVEGDAVVAVIPAGPLKPVVLQFSPAGQYLAVKGDGAGRTGLAVYDVTRREAILTVPEGASGSAFDFSADGTHLAAGRRDGAIVVHGLTEKGRSRRLTKGVVPSALRFSPDGRQLAIAGETQVEVRNLADATVSQSFRLPIGAMSIDWHPDAQSLAVGGADGRIFRLDLNRPQTVPETLDGHYGPVVSLDHHPGSGRLVSASWDGTLRLWDLSTGKQTMEIPIAEAEQLQFSTNGRELSLGRDGEDIWLWDVVMGDECRALVNAKGDVDATWSVDFLPRWGLLISGGDGGLRFDVPAENTQFAVPAVPGLSSVAFAPDGELMMTGGELGLRRWPIGFDDESILRIGPAEAFGLPAGLPTGRICLAPDGDTLAVVTDWERGHGVILQLSQPGKIRTIRSHAGMERLAFSSDSRWLATGTWKGSGVRIWDVRTGQLETDLPVEGSADMAFSPDGHSLVTGSGREYQLWEVESWRPQSSLKRRSAGSQPGKLAFSPDGSVLAITRSRDVVQLVDPRSLKVMATLEQPHPQHVASLGFSTDGTKLAVTYNTRVIHYWDLERIGSRLAELGLPWDRGHVSAARSKEPRMPEAVTLEMPSWLDLSVTARAHEAAGRWGEACGAYATAIDAGNRNPRDWSHFAVTLLITGQSAGYRRECRKLVEHFRGELPTAIANQIAWTCSLGPDATSDPERIVELARSAVRGDRDHPRLNTLGAALYWAGKYREAIDVLNQGIIAHGSGGVAQDWLFLAMAHQMLGEPTEAKRLLKQVQERGHHGSTGETGWQRQEIELLQTEASELIE